MCNSTKLSKVVQNLSFNTSVCIDQQNTVNVLASVILLCI